MIDRKKNMVETESTQQRPAAVKALQQSSICETAAIDLPAVIASMAALAAEREIAGRCGLPRERGRLTDMVEAKELAANQLYAAHVRTGALSTARDRVDQCRLVSTSDAGRKSRRTTVATRKYSKPL